MGQVKKAIYAGSFDPITNGHLWIIEQGSQLFDELIVILAHNPDKKTHLSVSERMKLLTQVCQSYKNITVLSNSDHYVASLAEKHQAQYLLRGIRNINDFEYEKTIERVNLQINPKLQTIYLTPPAHLSEISSSMVKSLVGFPGWEKLVSTMVPQAVLELLKKH